ncbi:MAG: hypothetical protein HZA08_06250 [Nitrospirae bacterium]|nr:hypothetical protein [Nitrospirota bacterium]
MSSPPSAPTGVTPAASDSQATIKWDTVSNATSYNIYWSRAEGVSKANGTKISGITSTSYWHTGLLENTTYYYVITAVNSFGESNVSNQIITEAYKFITKWGRSGTGDGQFAWPIGIAVDSSGNIYVVDSGNARIQKFTSNGTFITKWGSPGTGDGQFSGPSAIAVDSSGNVYVADASNARVQKFSSDGMFITKWGSSGTGDGQFDTPNGIAVDLFGNVYVADTWNARVQKFSSDGSFITKWAIYITGEIKYSDPISIAVDSLGNVYVPDNSNNCIKKFSPSGLLLKKWYFGSPGLGIAIDSSENVFITNNRYSVEKYNSNGTLINKWGSYGTDDGKFADSRGITIDAEGNAYVSDVSNNRIQKFSLTVPDFSNGLIAYYPFNGNANDESGNGHHGIVNGVALAYDRFYSADSAYSFNGINNYIELSNTAAFNFSSGGFTLAGWVKFNSTNSDNGIIGKHICNYSNGYFLGT